MDKLFVHLVSILVVAAATIVLCVVIVLKCCSCGGDLVVSLLASPTLQLASPCARPTALLFFMSDSSVPRLFCFLTASFR